jgi:hypothetical protein
MFLPKAAGHSLFHHPTFCRIRMCPFRMVVPFCTVQSPITPPFLTASGRNQISASMIPMARLPRKNPFTTDTILRGEKLQKREKKFPFPTICRIAQIQTVSLCNLTTNAGQKNLLLSEKNISFFVILWYNNNIKFLMKRSVQ